MLISAGAVGWRQAPACLARLRADAHCGTMASFPYGPVAAATGLSDAFTERADEPAAAHSHPKYRAEGAPVDPAVFIGTCPIDPICTVTNRRQVDLDGAPIECLFVSRGSVGLFHGL
jgi:hypothetical protein